MHLLVITIVCVCQLSWFTAASDILMRFVDDHASAGKDSHSCDSCYTGYLLSEGMCESMCDISQYPVMKVTRSFLEFNFTTMNFLC